MTDLSSSPLPHAAPERPRGCALSALMRRLGAIITDTASVPVWVRAEISEMNRRGGHLYFDLVERDAEGALTTKVRACIWRSSAGALLDKFASAAGSALHAGIKVLVLARVQFHAQYGLSLLIEDIDPAYTVGELQAQIQRIRETLVREGLYERNRQLPRPVDFHRVVVIAPEGAAGLGDFQAGARALEAAGLCAFVYVHATFQGPQAGASLVCAVERALAHLTAGRVDALVMIRGGGAAADLAWLNDLDLARALCRASVPVMVGIGHERDRTLLDEVACWQFDTPSKVLGGIEHTIVRRAQGGADHFAEIVQVAEARTHHAALQIDQRMQQISSAAQASMHRADVASTRLEQVLRTSAASALIQAAERIERLKEQIGSGAVSQVARAQVSLEALRAQSVERIEVALAASEQTVSDAYAQARQGAQQMLERAEEGAQRHLSTVLSLGPGPTLARGFAIVRHAGAPVCSAAAAQVSDHLELQFSDGVVHVRTA